MLETYVIHTTKLCNLDCKYCYEKDKSSIFTWEEIKETLDKIIKYNNKFIIEFLGGEPMLASDLIIKSYNYLESIKNIFIDRYVITTNSTIISDDFIFFLKNSPKVDWAASIDGDVYANQFRVFKKLNENGSQVNAHDKSIEVLKTVLKEIGPRRVGVHIVTHPFNVHLMHKSVNHFYELGIKMIGIGTIESTIPIGREYAEEFIKQINIISKKIILKEFDGLEIDILNHIKPREDVRNYIYDKNGKLIFESYSRAKNDVIINESLNIKSISKKTDSTILIEDIREEAYKIHQENILKYKRV